MLFHHLMVSLIREIINCAVHVLCFVLLKNLSFLSYHRLFVQGKLCVLIVNNWKMVIFCYFEKEIFEVNQG